MHHQKKEAKQTQARRRTADEAQRVLPDSDWPREDCSPAVRTHCEASARKQEQVRVQGLE